MSMTTKQEAEGLAAQVLEGLQEQFVSGELALGIGVVGFDHVIAEGAIHTTVTLRPLVIDRESGEVLLTLGDNHLAEGDTLVTELRVELEAGG